MKAIIEIETSNDFDTRRKEALNKVHALGKNLVELYRLITLEFDFQSFSSSATEVEIK